MGAGSIVDEYVKPEPPISTKSTFFRHGYYWLMNFFLFWLLVTLACTVCIWISDW